jgi:hypothetical protein
MSEAQLILGMPKQDDDAMEKDHALHQCMEDFSRCLLADKVPDLHGMKSAFRAAYEILDSEPHDEDPEEGE